MSRFLGLWPWGLAWPEAGLGGQVGLVMGMGLGSGCFWGGSLFPLLSIGLLTGWGRLLPLHSAPEGPHNPPYLPEAAPPFHHLSPLWSQEPLPPHLPSCVCVVYVCVSMCVAGGQGWGLYCMSPPALAFLSARGVGVGWGLASWQVHP